MSPEKYLLSFIGASLSLSESIKIAEVYLQLRDWEAVEKKVKSENLIQARTKSSIQRVYQELWPRLSLLSDEQLELLVDGNNQEQKQLLWYAICQRKTLEHVYANNGVPATPPLTIPAFRCFSHIFVSTWDQ